MHLKKKKQTTELKNTKKEQSQKEIYQELRTKIRNIITKDMSIQELQLLLSILEYLNYFESISENVETKQTKYFKGQTTIETYTFAINKVPWLKVVLHQKNNLANVIKIFERKFNNELDVIGETLGSIRKFHDNTVVRTKTYQDKNIIPIFENFYCFKENNLIVAEYKTNGVIIEQTVRQEDGTNWYLSKHEQTKETEDYFRKSLIKGSTKKN